MGKIDPTLGNREYDHTWNNGHCFGHLITEVLKPHWLTSHTGCFLDIVLFLPLLILCLRANASSAHFSFYLLLQLQLSERQQESKMKGATL